MLTDARTQAIEYRRQLLRIVDQIERDYKLGKYAPSLADEVFGLSDGRFEKAQNARIDTPPEKV